jgi:hypothetical protein
MQVNLARLRTVVGILLTHIAAIAQVGSGVTTIFQAQVFDAHAKAKHETS